MWTNLVKAGAYALAVKEISDRVAESKHYKEKVVSRYGKKNLLLGITVGSAMGVAAGILFAPRSGKLTRQELARLSSEALENLRGNLESAKEDIARKAEEKRKEVREKVEKCAEDAKENVAE